MNKPIRCTTHFHACDCREYEFEMMKKENERLKYELAYGVRIINDLKEELKSKDKDVGQDLKNVLNNVFKAIKEGDDEEGDS